MSAIANEKVKSKRAEQRFSETFEPKAGDLIQRSASAAEIRKSPLSI